MAGWSDSASWVQVWMSDDGTSVRRGFRQGRRRGAEVTCKQNHLHWDGQKLESTLGAMEGYRETTNNILLLFPFFSICTDRLDLMEEPAHLYQRQNTSPFLNVWLSGAFSLRSKNSFYSASFPICVCMHACVCKCVCVCVRGTLIAVERMEDRMQIH